MKLIREHPPVDQTGQPYRREQPFDLTRRLTQHPKRALSGFSRHDVVGGHPEKLGVDVPSDGILTDDQNGGLTRSPMHSAYPRFDLGYRAEETVNGR